jgi:hypothetical protein
VIELSVVKSIVTFMMMTCVFLSMGEPPDHVLAHHHSMHVE